MSRSVFLNFVALCFPVALAVLLAPALIFGLGAERFGLLALIWGLLNYFVVMDFGLGRAVTHAASSAIRSGKAADASNVLTVAVIATVTISAPLTVLGILASPWVTNSLLSGASPYRSETLEALTLLCGSLAFVALSSTLNGYLMAFGRFDLVNAVKVPLMAGTLCAPILTLHSEQPILLATLFMVLLRIISCLLLLFMCRLVSSAHAIAWPSKPALKGLCNLLTFGGWISVVNLVNSMIAYVDRWAIGAWGSLAEVTRYTVPLEFGTKILVIPAAVAPVLFPVFCRDPTESLNEQEKRLLYYGTAFTLAFCFFPAVLLSAFAFELLSAWLDATFAQKASVILQIALFGAFLNASAHPVAALLQGRGQSKSVACLLLVEFAVFIVLLWLAIPRFGVAGAVFAWLLRIAFDVVALAYIASRSLGVRFSNTSVACFALLLAMLLGSFFANTLAAKLAFCGCAAAISSVAISALSRRARQLVRA